MIKRVAAKLQHAFGALDWIRTSGLWSRSPTLYPAELRAQIFQSPKKRALFLNIEAEQNNVAVLHDVIFALRTDFSFFLCNLHISASHQLVK